MIKIQPYLAMILIGCLLATTQILAASSKTDSNIAHNKNASTTVSKNNSDKKATQKVQNINTLWDYLTPKERSAFEDRIQRERAAIRNPLSLILYRPTYILPFYYTGSPYTKIYHLNTPDNQNIMHEEFKAQLSMMVPIIPRLFHNPNASIDIAYTQLNYWQVYAKSQYFRETNYEPEVFVQDYFHRNWLVRAGIDHQSNGRGGFLERSWNRAIGTLQFSGGNWLIGVNAWVLIFQGESTELHNPDIAHFLGYENVLFSYKICQTTFSVQLQNLESGLSRGSVMVSVSHPILKHVYIYAQYFNGYGQSLIEYNHRTQSGGIGIALNDWL